VEIVQCVKARACVEAVDGVDYLVYRCLEMQRIVGVQ
jgi:hypothetical protein